MALPQRVTVLATLVAALCLLGCQAATSDEAQIQKATYRFISDLGRSDGKAACDLMTPALQLQQARVAGPPSHSCAMRATGVANSVNSVRGKLSLLSLTIARIDISGSNATVSFRGHQPVSVSLTKRGGDWLVSRYRV